MKKYIKKRGIWENMKDKNKSIEHSLVNKLLYASIALTSFQFEADDAVWSSDAEIASVAIPYVDANYERIVQEQEQRCGITFSSVPTYTFDAHPTTEGNAHYDPNTDAITFHTAGAFDTDGLAQVMTLLRVTRQQFRMELEGTVRHELAHDYFFERAEAFGTKGDWHDYSLDINGHPTSASIAKRTIIEGIGEYMSGKRREELDYGYDFVAPILSMNCKEGIDMIVQNHPLENEWENLLAYTRRIADAINN